MNASSDNQNRSLTIASWVLIGLVCLLSLIPFLGFASWFIVVPVLFVTLVMGIIVLARGGTIPGLGIMFTSLIVAPVFVVVAPFVTSLLGISGTIAAVGTSTAVGSRPTVLATPKQVSKPPSTKPGKPPSPLIRDETYQKFRDLIQTQASLISTLKAQQNAAEGPRGYLTGNDALDLAQRELVQKENYYREQVFETIASHTGMTQEQVAATFSAMARSARADASVP